MMDDRDAQIAALIRREIDKQKAHAERCGWATHTTAWHRAFGEIAGLHRALALVDPNPHSQSEQEEPKTDG